MAKHCFYRVIEHCEESQYKCSFARNLNVLRQFDAEDAAEICAEDYCSCHDGWESRWPLTFALRETEEGQECCRVLVSREMTPVFDGKMVRDGLR